LPYSSDISLLHAPKPFSKGVFQSMYVFSKIGAYEAASQPSVCFGVGEWNGWRRRTYPSRVNKKFDVNSAANQKSKNCISLYLYFAGRFAILQKSITNKSIELSNPTRHRRPDLSSKRSTNFIHSNEGPVTTQILSPTTEIQQKELNAR